MFEISIVMRDRLGEPLLTADGCVRRRTFYANDGDQLYDLWVRNSVIPNKRKQNKDAKNRQEVSKEQELGEDIQSPE